VISFTALTLYLRGKSSRYPLDGRLDGFQSRSGRYQEVKIRDPTGTRSLDPSVIQPITSGKENLTQEHSCLLLLLLLLIIIIIIITMMVTMATTVTT
jgi:hypothetical protein